MNRKYKQNIMSFRVYIMNHISFWEKKNHASTKVVFFNQHMLFRLVLILCCWPLVLKPIYVIHWCIKYLSIISMLIYYLYTRRNKLVFLFSFLKWRLFFIQFHWWNKELIITSYSLKLSPNQLISSSFEHVSPGIVGQVGSNDLMLVWIFKRSVLSGSRLSFWCKSL